MTYHYVITIIVHAHTPVRTPTRTIERTTVSHHYNLCMCGILVTTFRVSQLSRYNRKTYHVILLNLVLSHTNLL